MSTVTASTTWPRPSPVISLSTTVAENAGTLTLTATRFGGDIGPVTVAYTTIDGTALAGSDYTGVSGTFSWADGDMADKSVTIPLLDDTEEDDESFNFAISNQVGNATLGTPAMTVVTIRVRK